VHGDKLLSSSDDGLIKVRNTDTWACERTLKGSQTSVAVNCLVVHGDKLISGSDDGTATVWGS
jgi:WD40 repeat protein